ncbi:MAG: DUF2267 domain-containing protein [Gammaproteobacteria bacterium]
MQDLIQSIASQMGIEQETAHKAISGILELLNEQGSGAAELISQIPGASELMSSGGEGEGGGLLGGVADMLGGSGGAMAGLLSTGLSTGQLGSIGTMLVDYAKEHASPELVDKVLDSAPQLKSMLG